MIPEDQEKLIEQIASSTGGGVGREAARAKLDALHVQTSERLSMLDFT